VIKEESLWKKEEGEMKKEKKEEKVWKRGKTRFCLVLLP